MTAALNTTLTTAVADTIADWQAKHATICEHTQIIEYGEVAAAVVAKVADEIDTHAKTLMDTAVQQFMKSDDVSTVRHAATVGYVAKLLRGEQ